MKHEIETNLVGRKAKIAIGMDDIQIATAIDTGHKNSETSCWAHLGETGQIMAVYLDKDGPKCMLKMDTTNNLMEFYMSHLRVEG